MVLRLQFRLLDYILSFSPQLLEIQGSYLDSDLLSCDWFRRATDGGNVHHLHVRLVVRVDPGLVCGVVHVRGQSAVHAEVVGGQEGQTLHVLAVQITLYSLQLEETHGGSWVYRQEGWTDG